LYVGCAVAGQTETVRIILTFFFVRIMYVCAQSPLGVLKNCVVISRLSLLCALVRCLVRKKFLVSMERESSLSSSQKLRYSILFSRRWPNCTSSCDISATVIVINIIFTTRARSLKCFYHWDITCILVSDFLLILSTSYALVLVSLIIKCNKLLIIQIASRRAGE
jgi:hypothetical protein